MRGIILAALMGLVFLGTNKGQDMKTLHDFTVKAIDGTDYPLAQLKGKKVILVNTASKCGHTPQYKDLQKLYSEYSSKGLVIVGFPSNDFLKQEPGSNEEIKTFCEVNYGVTFPMMAKVKVKGSDMEPLYSWLTRKENNGVMDAPVTWNFQKFLIDEEGRWVKSIAPKTGVYSEEVLKWVKGE